MTTEELTIAVIELGLCEAELLKAIKSADRMLTYFIIVWKGRDKTRDKEIADNMKDYWKHQQCGAE